MSKIELSIMSDGFSFETLLKSIYKRIDVAMIRELVRNALDAHQISNVDRPIDFMLNEDVFYLRDYGRGISPTEMKELVSVLMKSSKRGDSATTGGHGLGSKTPFGLMIGTENRGILTSIHQGYKVVYELSIDESGMPSYVIINEGDSDEPSGVSYFIEVTGRLQPLRCHAYIKLFYPMIGRVNFIGFDYCSILHVESFEKYDVVALKSPKYLTESKGLVPEFISSHYDINGYNSLPKRDDSPTLSRGLLSNFITSTVPLPDIRFGIQLNRAVGGGAMYASIDGLVYAINETCLEHNNDIAKWVDSHAHAQLCRIIIENINTPLEERIFPLLVNSSERCFDSTIILKLDNWDGFQATRSRDSIEATGDHDILKPVVKEIISQDFITALDNVESGNYLHLKLYVEIIRMMASLIDYIIDSDQSFPLSDGILHKNGPSTYLITYIMRMVDAMDDSIEINKVGIEGNYTKQELLHILSIHNDVSTHLMAMFRDIGSGVTVESIFKATDELGYDDVATSVKHLDEHFGVDTGHDIYKLNRYVNTSWSTVKVNRNQGEVEMSGLHVSMSRYTSLAGSASVHTIYTMRNNELNTHSSHALMLGSKPMILVADSNLNMAKIQHILTNTDTDAIILTKYTDVKGKLFNYRSGTDMDSITFDRSSGVIETCTMFDIKPIFTSNAFDFKLKKKRVTNSGPRIPGIPNMESRPSSVSLDMSWCHARSVRYIDIYNAIEDSDRFYVHDTSTDNIERVVTDGDVTITYGITGDTVHRDTKFDPNALLLNEYFLVGNIRQQLDNTCDDDIAVLTINENTTNALKKYVLNHPKRRPLEEYFDYVIDESSVSDDIQPLEDDNYHQLLKVFMYVRARRELKRLTGKGSEIFMHTMTDESHHMDAYVYANILSALTGEDLIYPAIPQEMNIAAVIRAFINHYHYDRDDFMDKLDQLKKSVEMIQDKMVDVVDKHEALLGIMHYSVPSFSREKLIEVRTFLRNKGITSEKLCRDAFKPAIREIFINHIDKL